MSVVKIVAEFCEKYSLLERGDRVLLCMSLGKDSNVLYHVLGKVAEEIGATLVPLIVKFPKHRYSGIKVDIPGSIVVEPSEDDTILAERPCLKCKEIRRREIDRILASGNFSKVATAHTLWDLYAYTIEILLETGFNMREAAIREERILEMLSRFLPCYKAENTTIIHPLLPIGEDITSRIAETLETPIARPCKFRENRPKRILSKLFELTSPRATYDDIMNFMSESVDFEEVRAVLRTLPAERFLV